MEGERAFLPMHLEAVRKLTGASLSHAVKMLCRQSCLLEVGRTAVSAAHNFSLQTATRIQIADLPVPCCWERGVGSMVIIIIIALLPEHGSDASTSQLLGTRVTSNSYNQPIWFEVVAIVKFRRDGYCH